jgi:hypothetical protein
MKGIKRNAQFYNETLYGAKRIDEKSIMQITKKNILDLTKEDCKKYFATDDKNSDRVLLKTGDVKTYNQLVDIYNSFSEKPNPFKAALDDFNDKSDKKENQIFVISPKTGTKIYIKSIKIKGAIKQINEVMTIDENILSFYETFN